ncbi:hypothetical protein ACFX1R_020409 [Malus domestica]
MLSDDIEPRFIDECRRRTDWSNWKQEIQVELNSLAKRKVFGPIALTPPHVKLVGYKWVFIRKRNEKNKIICYKARLVAQGFSQHPGIDYDECDYFSLPYQFGSFQNTGYAANGRSNRVSLWEF